MRTLKGKILTFILAVGLSVSAFSSATPTLEKITFKKSSGISSDTADLNRYIREADLHLTWQRLGRFSPGLDEKGVLYLKSLIDTCEAICINKRLEFPSALHLLRAEYFMITDDFKSALQEANIAVKKSTNNGETEVLAKTMNFLGKYNLRTGFPLESKSNFENSIRIAKKNRLNGLIPRNYEGLADVYDKLGKLDDFRNTLKISIDAAHQENDTRYQEFGYFRLGSSYCMDSLTARERNFKLADSLLRRCLEISLAVNDTPFIASALQNIGWNYYVERDYNSAIKYYNKSLGYSTPARIYSSSDNSFGNLGTIYRDIGLVKKSLENYQTAIEQAQLINDIRTLSWVHGDMSNLYLNIGDTSKAYKSYVIYKKYSDMMMEKESSQGLFDARIRYDAESHNKEVELLSLKLYNQRLLIYGSSGVFILSIAVFILLLGQAKLKAKRRISEMNRQISEITQANLRQQMNPHFIFNTLNSIQYYMYQHDKLATNTYLTKFSSLMRKVLENSQYTAVPLRDELEALNLYLDLEMIRFKDKFEYQINVDEEIDSLLYKVPTMLIQPYVENSICHGLMPCENKGFVSVDLKLENRYILCTIEDNGVGRQVANANKLKRDNDHNSLGTKIITSRLDLVNALYGTSLKTIYTDLRNENGEPSGTRVEIQIPILS